MTQAAPRTGHAVGYFFIAASATGYGFMPLLALRAYDAGLNVPTVLFLRFAIATVLFAPPALWHDLRPHPRPDGTVVQWRPRWRPVLACTGLGVLVYTGQAMLYFTAVKMVGASLAALLLYLYPGLVAAGAMLSRRLVRSWKVPAVLAVALVGVVLAVGRGGESQMDLAGVLVGLGAAATYAFYVLAGDRLSAEIPSRSLALILFASTAVTLGTIGVLTGSLHLRGVGLQGWLAVIGLALACTIVGIFCFFMGVVRVGPTHASLVSLIELVVAILAGVVLLGEQMRPVQWLGAVIVLGAALVGARIMAPPPALSPEAEESIG